MVPSPATGPKRARLSPELAEELRAAYAAEREARRRAREAAGETDAAIARARAAGIAYHGIARLLVPAGTSCNRWRRAAAIRRLLANVSSAGA